MILLLFFDITEIDVAKPLKSFMTIGAIVC